MANPGDKPAPAAGAAPAPAPATDKAPGGSGGPTLVTVATAVASGLGVLGFVAFAGGVVLWTRFNEMGLPANHAVSLVAKSELVATGAEFLVPALLLPALIVLIVILIDGVGRIGIERTVVLRFVAPVLIVCTGVVFSLATLKVVPLSALFLLLGVSILGGVVVNRCAKLPFAAYCLVVFLAAGAFVIARTYERTANALEVIPMAYARSQPGEEPRVEVGYFVAETSDRILFASVPRGSQNELREFPRSETDDLEVGALASPEEAEQIAARFAYNLCVRLLSLTPSKHPLTESATPVCSPSRLEELKSKAGLS
jgi:hypothetical protein